ncbi:MaoC family dehydratase N-terminal domain-containing protein [uncultured Sphingomonas sp.]|uniref:MaoC family dehydratase N-terminal domain-containing protein n=1 Tax=uncultured Sphingomonas sp. TaxID=158754 RepID=UPI0035C9E7D5
MIDRSFIGATSPPREVDVEKGQLKFFAKATGATDPIYFDDEAARAAGHPTIPAPPTFVFSLMLAVPPKGVDIFVDLGVSKKNVLHGEQAFSYHRGIYAGDCMTLVSSIPDIYDKKGGALEFIIQDTTATNQLGELCVTMRSVTVVRNGGAER